MYIYNYIKTVIANSEPEKYLNTTTFIFNTSKVVIIENSMAKGRYPDPDTIIVFSDEKYEIIITITFNEKLNYYSFRVRPLPLKTVLPSP
jgi:hypothetical protein